MTVDARVIAAVRGGNAEAFDLIVREYQPRLYRFLYGMVGDAEVARDLTQDTFLKMFRGLRQYDPSLRFSSWLFRIAHNTAIDTLRQRRVPLAVPPVNPDGEEVDPLVQVPDVGAESPEQSASRRELGEMLDAAIDALRPPYRAVVILRHQEELDYEEIAEVMQLPLGTVKTYLHRARKELAERLRSRGFGPAETASGARP